MGAEIRVRVQAGASREGVAGEREGAVVVRVTARPVDGKANEALRRLIAKQAGVARGQVTIVRGERGRDKVVRVEGVDERGLRRALTN